MKTRTLILFGLLAMFLFGCVSLDYTQKVDRDGNSVIIQKIDMSALLALSGSSDSDMSTICENMTQGQPGVNCTYSDGVISLSKAFSPTEGAYTFKKSSEFPNIVYTLELKKLPELVKSEDSLSSGSMESTTSDFAAAQSKTAATSLKTMNATITYQVQMPGDIVSAENGQIISGADGKKVAKYDVLQLMTDGKYIVVKSSELDLTTVLIAVGGLVLLVGAIAVAFVLLKASKKPAGPSPKPPATPSA